MNRRNDRGRLAALLDEMSIRRARQSLRFFVEWAWPILEPGTVFQANYHIDPICEYLEAVTDATSSAAMPKVWRVITHSAVAG